VKLTETGLLVTYLLLGVALISIVGGSVFNVLRKK